MKKVIANIVALVLLIAGIALAVLGLQGQSYYDDATTILGVKKPETAAFLLDPTTIEEVAHGLGEAEYNRILKNTFGLTDGDIGTAVADIVAYDAAKATVSEESYYVNYIMSNKGVATEDEAKEIKKDKEQFAPIQTEMLTQELGIDAASLAALESDSAMIGVIGAGFENLKTNYGFKTTLFNNSILLMFVGIIFGVAGLAFVFISIVGGAKKAKKGHAVKMSPKATKIGDFILNYALYIILLGILAFVCIMRPNFLDVTNLMNILKQASTKGILALGCAGLIVLAGTDLSIGRVVGLSAAVTASLVQATDYSSRMFPQMTTQLPLWVPLLAAIAVGVIFSLINGFGVSRLHLHAFIVTLGTQLIAQGLCCIYIESQPSGTAQALSTFDRNFINFAAGNLTIGEMKIPLVALYFIGIALIMWVIWNKTRLGKNMFAVGGNTEAAAVSGVNVAMTIMLVYLIAGVLYGVSAYLEAARITSVGANTGINYETDAISACVVGGVSFSGGVGTIQGVVIGAIILQAINYSLQFMGVNPYLQYVIRGLIIILAVSIDVRKYIVKK